MFSARFGLVLDLGIMTRKPPMSRAGITWSGPKSDDGTVLAVLEHAQSFATMYPSNR